MVKGCHWAEGGEGGEGADITVEGRFSLCLQKARVGWRLFPHWRGCCYFFHQSYWAEGRKGGRGVTVVLRGEQPSLWKMCSYINLYSSTTVQCAQNTAIYKFVKTLQFGVGWGGGIFSRLPERCAQLDKRGRWNCS